MGLKVGQDSNICSVLLIPQRPAFRKRMERIIVNLLYPQEPKPLSKFPRYDLVLES